MCEYLVFKCVLVCVNSNYVCSVYRDWVENTLNITGIDFTCKNKKVILLIIIN